MKIYTVKYIEKYDSVEHESCLEVEAENAKEACKKVVAINYERTGRHAFRPKATVKPQA